MSSQQRAVAQILQSLYEICNVDSNATNQLLMIKMSMMQPLLQRKLLPAVALTALFAFLICEIWIIVLYYTKLKVLRHCCASHEISKILITFQLLDQRAPMRLSLMCVILPFLHRCWLSVTDNLSMAWLDHHNRRKTFAQSAKMESFVFERPTRMWVSHYFSIHVANLSIVLYGDKFNVRIGLQ